MARLSGLAEFYCIRFQKEFILCRIISSVAYTIKFSKVSGFSVYHNNVQSRNATIYQRSGIHITYSSKINHYYSSE